jgi:LSU ribosomal protein L9P
MDVILLQRVEKLGQMGDIVTVKPGFARNYLIPKGYADRATKERLAHFETMKKQLEAENLKQKQEADAVAKKMEGLTLTFIRSAGETAQLYGSVRPQDIAEGVIDAGFTISRTQVHIETPIKTLGLHTVYVVLHPEVRVAVTLNIAKTEEEARNQLASNTEEK